MPWNLLLLPLAGGYIFVSRFNRFKYFTLRLDSYRLLLHSAVAGAVLLFVASASVELALKSRRFGPVAERARDLWVDYVFPSPQGYTGSGRAALAFVVGALAWVPLNRMHRFSEERQSDFVIEQKNDALEMLLRVAVGKNRLIFLTLKGEKVYVARVVELFNPAFPLEHIAILPVRSGYRRDSDKKVVLTNDYRPFLEKLNDDLKRKKTELELTGKYPTSQIRRLLAASEEGVRADFKVVIPQSEIQSVSFFEEELYAEVEPEAKPASPWGDVIRALGSYLNRE